MKKRNAFALKDFDGERILQRPYFKSFGFAEGLSDSEILDLLKPTADDSVDEMEKRLIEIEKVQDKLVEFIRFIGKHFNRLRDLRFSKTKPQRNDYVVEKCLAVEMNVAELAQTISTLYDMTEKKIHQKYSQVFAENLRKYRKAAGLTQFALADLIRTSQVNLSRYEKNEREMPIYALARTSKVLGVTADELLGIR